MMVGLRFFSIFIYSVKSGDFKFFDFVARLATRITANRHCRATVKFSLTKRGIIGRLVKTCCHALLNVFAYF